MKQVFIILAICFSSAFAFAQFEDGFARPGRPGRPGDPGRDPGPGRGGYAPIQCSITDRGWEEHRGGHRSCNECEREHGSCVQTCGRVFFTCQAEAVDRRGRRYRSVGRAESRFRAQREALRACRYYGYQYCRIRTCYQDSETISRRRCR